MTFLFKPKTSTKKLAIFAIMALLATVFLSAGSFLTVKADITTGLILYYPQEEGSGTVAVDTSGQNNHGTINGAPTWGTGKFGQAITFDGVNDYVNIGDKLDLGTSDRSYSFWIKTTAVSGRIFEKYEWLTTWNGIFALITSDGKIQIGIGNGTTYLNKISSYVINDNEWHFVALTFDRSQYAFIYIDNYPRDSLDISSLASYDIQNAVDFCFGSAGGSAYYAGMLDSYKVFNRVLSPTDVTELYAYNPNPTSTPTPTSIPDLSESAFTYNGIIILALFIVLSLYLSIRPIGTVNLAFGILTLGVSAGLALGGYLGGLWFFTFAGVALGLICMLRGTDLL